MGQPPKFVDWSKLDFSCKLGGSLSITAGYCEVSEDTIERAIQKNKGMTFREYRDQLMSTSRLKLIQKAMSKAFDGDNTMLIWCMKNQCGWSDKVEKVILDGGRIKGLHEQIVEEIEKNENQK